jgi:hypothetical protein
MQAEIAQRLIKASAGTGLMLWGMKAAANGNATGSFPQDQPSAQVGPRGEGRQHGEDRRHLAIDHLARPMSIPFLLGVNLQHAEDAPTVRQKARDRRRLHGQDPDGDDLPVRRLLDRQRARGPIKGGDRGSPDRTPSAIDRPADRRGCGPSPAPGDDVGEKMQAKIPFASKACRPGSTPSATR